MLYDNIMKKNNLVIFGGIIILLGLSIPLYVYFNPLSGTNEKLEPGDVLSEGEFVQIDSAHWGTGTVKVIQKENDNVELQFHNVEIANGPDLYVYLSDKSIFLGTDDNIGVISNLGALSFNQGNFTVPIDFNTDLDNVNSVLIYCFEYSVIFTYAPLM